MPAPWCRRCWCKRQGGAWSNPCNTSRVRWYDAAGGVHIVENPPYLPRTIVLTLPSGLDLQYYVEADGHRPYMPDAAAVLCPGATTTIKLFTQCNPFVGYNWAEQYSGDSPRSVCFICLEDGEVYSAGRPPHLRRPAEVVMGYRLWGGSCPTPSLLFRYWWSNDTPCTVEDCNDYDIPELPEDDDPYCTVEHPCDTDPMPGFCQPCSYVGVPQPGTLGVTFELLVPTITASGAHEYVGYRGSKVLGHPAWPTMAWDGDTSPAGLLIRDADRAAWANALGAFFRGEKGLPTGTFDGPWFFTGSTYNCRGACLLDIPVSYDALYPSSLRLPCEGPASPPSILCDGSEDNVGFTGISVQLGETSIPDTPRDAQAVYVATSQLEQCLGDDECKADCVAVSSTSFAGGEPLTTEAFPAAVEVQLPPSLDMSYRDGTACGNNGPNRPSPWMLAGPARCVVRLPDDVESPPYCGADFFVSIVSGPWATAFMANSTAWENCGVELTAGYRPGGTDCLGNPLASPLVFLSIGFVRKSPTSVDLADAIFQLYTLARVYIQLEQIVGLPWSVPLHGLRLGPEFRFGDWATTPFVQPDDPVVAFFGVDNALGWTPEFDFDGSFYEDYVPTVAATECVGYSYHPGVYHSSIARTISGVNALADYCGQAAAFQRCARGANHAHQLIVRPTHGPRSIVRPEAHLRYCAAGAACLPLEPCP